MKKILSIFLVIAMLIITCTVSAAYYTDIDGHWAKNEIEAWSDYGVISGYDGKFSPNRYITRGEFAVVLNRLMGYQKESANIFNDLPDKFYTTSVLRLYQAGVMQGYGGYISPEASLTREEASVMICRALGIVTQDKMNRAFSDEANISSWSKPYINAMVNIGLLNGADGKLNPKNPIMRCEVVKILDNAVYPILKTGTFESVNTDKIVVISAGNVVIKNSEIKGKVIVTQGVNSGKISFTDSKIEREFVIDNDRDAFIEINNTTVADQSILNNKAFATDKKEVNTEMVEKLKAVSEEIAPYIDRNSPDYTVFTGAEKNMLKKIKDCIDDAVANHASELDADFIINTYHNEIKEVQSVYDTMAADGKDDAFVGKMATNFTIYNLIWLADTLGVNLEKYGINPSDYM